MYCVKMRKGPDGRLNGGTKTLKGNSSEKVGNVLEAKTPEEAYIANCEAEIKEIKEKMEENEKVLKELEKKLPSYDEKKEIEKKMVEEFSIKKLSEILSEDELDVVKKGRDYEDLLVAIKGRDQYDDLIERIYDGIKDFSDEEKLIISEYLLSRQIVLLNMSQYEVKMGHNCRAGFYYEDFPDEMYKAREVKGNIRKLGLEKYVDYVGDSCYRIDDEFYANAREKVRKENTSDVENKNQENIDNLKKEGQDLEKSLESLEKRKLAVEKYGLPEREAISLYQWSEKLAGVHDEVYDKGNHVCVVLHEYTDYSGSGGSEYGTIIHIKRGKNIIHKRFKYRDRYDYNDNIPRHEYKKIESVKVDGDKVEVKVSNGKFTDTYAFDISYRESNKAIDRKEFEESIKKIEKQLIDENTKKENYIASYNLSMRKVPGAFDHKSMDLESEVSYEEAKIIYEDIDPESGEVHIIIRKHMDASGDMGRQFGLVKYVITPEGGAKVVNEYSYREWALDDENVKKKIAEFSKW